MTIENEIEEFDFVHGCVSELFNLCNRVKTREQANRIKQRYCNVNPDALGNLGYIFGYGNADERQKLYYIFDLTHPLTNTPV